MVVLVTGGLGFVGSRLCARLAARGDEVVCVDSLSARYSPCAGRDAARSLVASARVRVLIEDVDALDAARLLEPVDAVVHLAALPGVRSRHDPATLWERNVALSARLAERAASAGKRFVLASSSSVYGNAAALPTPEDAPPKPLGPYAATKLAAERACLRAGAEVVVARLFTVFGPGQRPDMALSRWIAAIRGNAPLDWHVHVGGARELTHVDDAASGLIAALERGRPGEAYNIGGSGSHRMEHVLALLERELGRRARLRRVAPSPGDAVVTAACGLKSEAELRFRPRVGLAEGLRSQLAATAASRAPEAGRPDPAARRRAPAPQPLPAG